MNEDTCQDLDASEQRDPELIRGYLSDAPVRFEERELKAGMHNSEMMAPEKPTEKAPEMLRMGEKNSHNRNQL